MPKQIKIRVNDPFLKQDKRDKGWKIEFSASQDQYEALKDLPTPDWQDKNLEITIKEEEEI